MQRLSPRGSTQPERMETRVTSTSPFLLRPGRAPAAGVPARHPGTTGVRTHVKEQ